MANSYAPTLTASFYPQTYSPYMVELRWWSNFNYPNYKIYRNGQPLQLLEPGVTPSGAYVWQYEDDNAWDPSGIVTYQVSQIWPGIGPVGTEGPLSNPVSGKVPIAPQAVPGQAVSLGMGAVGLAQTGYGFAGGQVVAAQQVPAQMYTPLASYAQGVYGLVPLVAPQAPAAAPIPSQWPITTQVQPPPWPTPAPQTAPAPLQAGSLQVGWPWLE